MGMFDSVYFPCPTPRCTNDIEVQSKAGECVLASYSPDEVPVEIAIDIGGESAWCNKCERTFTVARALNDRVSMHLVGAAAPCQHCGR